jgi:hypothetical protein
LPVFVEQRVWVLDQKPQADGAHFVLKLKLHMELDRVSAKPDIICLFGLVFKGKLEAEPLGIELNRPLNVSRTDNGVSFFEHYGLLMSSGRFALLTTLKVYHAER